MVRQELHVSLRTQVMRNDLIFFRGLAMGLCNPLQRIPVSDRSRYLFCRLSSLQHAFRTEAVTTQGRNSRGQIASRVPIIRPDPVVPIDARSRGQPQRPRVPPTPLLEKQRVCHRFLYGLDPYGLDRLSIDRAP